MPCLPTEPFYRLCLTKEYDAYLRGSAEPFPPPQYVRLFGQQPTKPRPCTYQELQRANENQDVASIVQSDVFKDQYNVLKNPKEEPEL
jgi:hypothetical protein